MPAQTTAKIVMASAKRLMELRQVCLKSSRMAEISVPAWPIPIHQTKLIIAKPQATGWVTAQMPVPLRNSHVTATSSTVAPPPAMPKNARNPSGVCGVSTMREIFSVIDLKVSPCPMTRNSPVLGSMPGSEGLTSLVAIVMSTLCRRMFHRLLFEFRIRIQNFGEVAGARTRVLVGDDLVHALVFVQFRHLARLVVEVAEGDHLRRARLLAGCNDLAIANRAGLLVGFNLRRVDALHEVAALLHDAARSNGDVRIAHRLQALGLEIGVEQEVEAPHLVWAVVGAVAGAHATVVNHRIEAFGRMYRCADRTNLFARSVLTVLAGHRLEVRARRRQIAFVVRIDAQPLHVSADPDLLLADNRNIVLRVAGHDASVAAGTAVHVDRHAPLVAVVLPVGEQRSVHLRRIAA